jgi:hypothetical protein
MRIKENVKIGRLTPLSSHKGLNAKGVFWKVQCDCGTIFDMAESTLKTRRKCSNCKGTSDFKYKPGDKINKLTYIKPVMTTQMMYLFQCDCGTAVKKAKSDCNKLNLVSCNKCRIQTHKDTIGKKVSW